MISPIKRMSHYSPEYSDELIRHFIAYAELVNDDYECGTALNDKVYTKMTDDEVDTFIHKMVEQLGDEAWQFFNENIYITSGG